MTRKTDVSGALALSPRPRNAAHVAPKNLDNHQTLRTATTLDPAPPAEIAQARLFEHLLQAERAELEQLADRVRHATDQDNAETTVDLTQTRARLDEIRRLLRALQGRFPHAKPDLDR